LARAVLDNDLNRVIYISNLLSSRCYAGKFVGIRMFMANMTEPSVQLLHLVD